MTAPIDVERKVRDKRIIKQRCRGASIRQIAEDEGMSPREAFLAVKRLEPQILTALKRTGYDLHKAIVEMLEMTEANETRLFVIDGQIVEHQIPDNATRLKARTRLLNLHVGNDSGGTNAPPTPNVQVMVITGYTEERVKALRQGSRAETISVQAHDSAPENPPESSDQLAPASSGPEKV